MTERITIFLPAAGLGERLRPITKHLPKPLLPILGKPLLEVILEKLENVSAGNIGINLHYKAELIREWTGKSVYADRITFFPEDPILGTGGALKNAEAFLADGPFIVHNSDILLDIDFKRLVNAHLSSGNIATLATHNYPKLNKLLVDENGFLIRLRKPEESEPDPALKKLAYTGVAVYSPEILNFLPPGVSHVTTAWTAAVNAGYRIQAFDVTGCYWNDVGTPATYAAEILEALRLSGETVFNSSAVKCNAIKTDGYIVLESGSIVNEGAFLRNSIVMPGAKVSGTHENHIIGPDYILELTESQMQPAINAREEKKVSLGDPIFANYFGEGEGTAQAILIGFGGSDRRYFRVRSRGKSAILMECHPDDPDFTRHMDHTRFFAANGVPVPELLGVEIGLKRALFEDLGDTSLYSHLKLSQTESHIKELYKKVIDILLRLHSYAEKKISGYPLIAARVFDYEHLRWETGYFLERFVKDLKGITPDRPELLEAELHRLALLVDSFPKGIVHRDFQSQNIMIAKGRPRVIDYQGARMGPPAYDLVSILWDPYYRLAEEIRNYVLSYYIAGRKNQERDFSEEDFRKTLVPCRLQRHMQALGAYGFLSKIKGKKYFLKHVPGALRLLREDISDAQKDYPALYSLVTSLVSP